jgi:hypothetical protein
VVLSYTVLEVTDSPQLTDTPPKSRHRTFVERDCRYSSPITLCSSNLTTFQRCEPYSQYSLHAHLDEAVNVVNSLSADDTLCYAFYDTVPLFKHSNKRKTDNKVMEISAIVRVKAYSW